jgi:hypothetical protein
MDEANGPRNPQFHNNMSTAAVFSDIEEVFDTKLLHSLLCKLSKLEFSTSVIKLISSFLSQRKFRVSVEGEIGIYATIYATPWIHNLYINDTPPNNWF